MPRYWVGMPSEKITLVLPPPLAAAVNSRAQRLGMEPAAYARMLIHGVIHNADPLPYALRVVVPELARRYPDGAPDGTKWEDAPITTILDVAAGLLTRERVTPPPADLLVIETERESEGRWIAEVPSMPGCLVYGATRWEAIRRVVELAAEVGKP